MGGTYADARRGATSTGSRGRMESSVEARGRPRPAPSGAGVGGDRRHEAGGRVLNGLDGHRQAEPREGSAGDRADRAEASAGEPCGERAGGPGAANCRAVLLEVKVM